MNNDNFEFKSFESGTNHYLHFTFRDKFTVADAEKAVKAWSSYYESYPAEKFIHIWDCQKMSGFDQAAKNLWMEYLKKYKNQTIKAIIVSDNIIIRGAARLMSRFTSLHLDVYKSIGEMAMHEMLDKVA